MFKKLFASFDNNTLGYSARKLTAFASLCVAAGVTYTLPADAKLHALYAWLLLVLLCLGIVTIEQIIRLKASQSQTIKETETTTSSTEKTVEQTPQQN